VDFTNASFPFTIYPLRVQLAHLDRVFDFESNAPYRVWFSKQQFASLSQSLSVASLLETLVRSACAAQKTIPVVPRGNRLRQSSLRRTKRSRVTPAVRTRIIFLTWPRWTQNLFRHRDRNNGQSEKVWEAAPEKFHRCPYESEGWVS